MSETIKGAGDIYQKDLYGDLGRSAKDVIALIEAVNDGLKETAKINAKIIDIDPKDIKNIDEINKGIDQTNQAFEQKIKLDNERLKQEKRIFDAQQKNIKSQEELANQLTDLEVKSRKLTKAKADLLKRIDQESKQRRAGNDEIADAIKLNKEEEEQLSKLTQEITLINLERAESAKANKLLAKESLGLTSEYQRQSKRLNDLRKEFKDLLLIEGKTTKETRRLEKEVNDLDRTLKDVDEAAGQFQRNVGNYPGTLKDASSALLKTAAAALSVKGAFEGVSTSVQESAEGSEALRKVTGAVSGALDQVKNVTANAALDLFRFGRAVVQGEKSITEIGGAFEETANASENFTDKVKESAEATIALNQAAIDFEKTSRAVEQQISVLNGRIEQQQIIAGDSTRSFETINAAILEGQRLQIERARLSQSLAQQELQQIQEEIRIKELAGGASVALLDEETQAIIKLQDARNQIANEIKENEKEIRQVQQDRLEIDLDILIDGFDNQKTINERIISNEKETLQRRAALLDQTNKLAEASFQGQKDVLEDLSKAGINVDDLLLLDATELAKQIRLLEQSEIINTRTLEVIRERRIVLQDLEDAQNDLNEAQQEGIDINADILAQQEALGKQTLEALEDLESDRFNNQKKSLERRLELSKEGSLEALKLEQELNDLLLSEQERKLEEEKALDEKAAADKLALQKSILSKLEEFQDKASEKRIEALDEQLEESEKQEERLRELAQRGSLDAQASIAEENKKQLELQRAKAAEERKQELVTAGFKVFTALLEQGKEPGAATLETAAILGALPAIIDAIPAFFDGIEDTGKASNPLDSNGGRLSILHDNERVMTAKQNEKMGGISNDEAASVIDKYNKGLFSDLHSFNKPSFDTGIMQSIQMNGLNKGLERKIDNLIDATKAIKMPKTSLEADYVRNLFKATTRTGNTIKTETSKLH